jgi:hypothetical protein
LQLKASCEGEREAGRERVWRMRYSRYTARERVCVAYEIL